MSIITKPNRELEGRVCVKVVKVVYVTLVIYTSRDILPEITGLLSINTEGGM